MIGAEIIRRRELPPGTLPTDKPVRCPSCGTYSVGLEPASTGEGPTRNVCRCINGHRWVVEQVEIGGKLFLAYYRTLGTYIANSDPWVFRCLQCDHEAAWRRGHGYTCLHCGYNKADTVRWPADAYFQCAVDGQVLWARNRSGAVALRDFIASSRQEAFDYPGHESFLSYVPKHFLLAKRRDLIVRQLERLLRV